MSHKLAVYGLAIKRHTADDCPHTARMAMQREIALSLAHNLQRLMDDKDLSQAELARQSGVGQRTISTLLDVENPSAINPRTDTLERLAAHFGIPVWQLLIPNMPLELLKSPRLTKLLENYVEAPSKGREQVERIAESEVKYAVAESVLTGGKKTGTGGG